MNALMISTLDRTSRGRRWMASRGRHAGRRPHFRLRPEALEARALLTAIALDDSYRLIQGQAFQSAAPGVLGNDLIASGDPLTVSANTTPTNGTLVLAPGGGFTYTPNPGYSGPDSFSYTISDGLGGTDVGLVTLDVVPTAATEAAIAAGPRLASVDSTRGVLLDAVLGGLLDTSVSLDVLDWNGLAQGGVNAANFVEALRVDLGVASTSDALTADATLFQVFNAAATAAQAEGSTALADAFDALALDVAGLAGTIRVGDLLQVDPNDGSLARVALNGLDLATAGVQLFNFDNVAATNNPVTISGAALGLGSVVDSIALSARVVEPPTVVVGPVGTTFQTAATRLRLDLDLVDASLDTSQLVADLLGPLGVALGGAVTVDASADLGQLSLYVDVAPGDGALTLIDAVSNAVTIQGTPGVANVYIGAIPDALFFDPAYVIDPADVTPTVVGDLAIAADVGGVPTIAASAGLGLRLIGLGQAPLVDSLVYGGPFPQTQTFGSSATFVTNLINSLATSLELSVEGTLGATLDGLVNSVILPALTPVVTDAVSPVLATVLGSVVDPTLDSLGIGLGEMDVTVAPLIPVVSPLANADFVRTSEDGPVAIAVLDNDAVAPAGSAAVSSVTQPTNGSVVVNPDGTITYTPNPNFFGSDSFTYTLTGPGGGTSTATVTLQVLAVNDPPTANPDAYNLLEDGVLTVPGPGVLGNDTDPDADPLTAVIVAGPSNGTLVLNPDGSFTYTPNPNFNGSDSFTYQAGDGSSLSAPAVVTITVSPVNDAPVANPDVYQTNGGVLTVAGPGLLANDFDPDGSGIAVELASWPSNGTLTINPDGSFSYIPNAGFVGVDTFSYRASDGELLSPPVNVTINVTAAPDAAPQVLAVERYGFHHQPTRIVVRFSADLDPARAQDVSNYVLLGPGRDGRFGTRDDVRYAVQSATYDPATRSVTLAPTQQLALRSAYRLTVQDGATGLTSVGGLALDGDRDGVPGGAAVVTFDQSALAGPSVATNAGRRVAAPRGPLVFPRGPAARRTPLAPRFAARTAAHRPLVAPHWAQRLARPGTWS